MSTVLKEEESSETEPQEKDIDKSILTGEELFKQIAKAKREPSNMKEEAEDLSKENRVINSIPPPEECTFELVDV